MRNGRLTAHPSPSGCSKLLLSVVIGGPPLSVFFEGFKFAAHLSQSFYRAIASARMWAINDRRINIGQALNSLRSYFAKGKNPGRLMLIDNAHHVLPIGWEERTRVSADFAA